MPVPPIIYMIDEEGSGYIKFPHLHDVLGGCGLDIFDSMTMPCTRAIG
ncbi:Uncharacterised protein [Chlamydia trachomatis]|nr:Uncharacterised protein [Chlamydia trachomatis]